MTGLDEEASTMGRVLGSAVSMQSARTCVFYFLKYLLKHIEPSPDSSSERVYYLPISRIITLLRIYYLPSLHYSALRARDQSTPEAARRHWQKEVGKSRMRTGSLDFSALRGSHAALWRCPLHADWLHPVQPAGWSLTGSAPPTQQDR